MEANVANEGHLPPSPDELLDLVRERRHRIGNASGGVGVRGVAGDWIFLLGGVDHGGQPLLPDALVEVGRLAVAWLSAADERVHRADAPTTPSGIRGFLYRAADVLDLRGEAAW